MIFSSDFFDDLCSNLLGDVHEKLLEEQLFYDVAASVSWIFCAQMPFESLVFGSPFSSKGCLRLLLQIWVHSSFLSYLVYLF